MTAVIKINDIFEDIEVSVVCNVCGEDLECYWHNYELVINPCENCMESFGEEKYEEGHTEGYEEGYRDGADY